MDKADKDTIQRIKRDRDIERERVRVGEKERKRARDIMEMADWSNGWVPRYT